MKVEFKEQMSSLIDRPAMEIMLSDFKYDKN